MLIHCPSCDFETTLPSSKEGAKLRCPECSRVFVARPRATGGRRSSSSSGDSTRYMMIGGVVVVGIALFMMFGRGSEDSTAAPKRAPVETVTKQVAQETDGSGWDSAAVQFALEMHTAAFGQNEAQLLIAVDWARAWAFTHPDEGSWSEVARTRQTEIQAQVVADLTRGSASELIARWEPFDGWIETQDNEEHLVRVRVAHREDAEAANRHVEWRLVKLDGRWKAYGWTRWISEEEQKAIDRGARAAVEDAKPKVVRKTLSDGSRVIESTVRRIPYMPDTTAELREKIDGLVAELTDIEAAGRVRIKAKEGLTEIGKQAIPALLTVIAEIPHTDMDSGMKLQQVNMALMDITGHYTSFKPHITLGATEERQESGLKQWFGWYDRKFNRFTEAPEVPDPLAEDE
ncbi:MAG: hypothetical protein ACI8QZ_002312 [Chlamydiales bacterium]|jgi:hypothetical protein